MYCISISPATKPCTHHMKNKSKNNWLSFYVRLKTSAPKSEPAVLLMNPDDFGDLVAARRGTHDGSVSPVIWFWYVSIFLCRIPTFHLPHAEVNLCSCRHFLRLEIWRRATKDMPLRYAGTQPNEDEAEQIFPQVDKSWHRHRCIWQIPPAFVHV